MIVVRVLLMSASFGDGHMQAANAVGEALRRRGVTVKLVDYTQWLNPALRSFAKFSLIQGVQLAPALYEVFYKSMSRLDRDSSLQRRINRLGMAKFKRCLKAYAPDVVVSTFPTPNGVMAQLREQGFTRIPVAAVLTDYTAHGQWVQEHTKLYFVATEQVKAELTALGVASERIVVSGMPIRTRFEDSGARQALARRRELRQAERLSAERPLVLLMGGGAGLVADVAEWMEVMQATPVQFAVICGRNDKLYRRLRPLHSDRIRVLGYTTEMERWMAMADVVVTKPGGITVAEALAMELPMLLYHPIPGQEVCNGQYVVDLGAARWVTDIQHAAEELRQLQEHPDNLQAMRRAARAAHRRGAAGRIAEWLMRYAADEAGTPMPVIGQPGGWE
ncbi:MGDG synthase family glycosyltransferase [Alicyclobacillus shizuokensis]|uniref:MGDG synthase family glycosyltransferase n=1 Tax=Alicyclobacillus shizuokensis TaxID=392014 RepID=UPI0008299071|nr:glycosyltransferase [Alicyclobacillus shizuokensis]MCL6626286.1 glycosyltransferase [Alicyclobacillus shizuokensis]